MSIVSEINRVNNNIADAYSSVGNKGGTLPQVQNSANLSSAIDSIPAGGGGGSASSNDVNFYDYDGTLLHSYSASEFAGLTEMPANPTHQGLTAQGWNWSLANAKEYVAEYGMLDVGQMYVTDDGKTRIYITLEEGRLEPYLGLRINGTATVDWGDGNIETVTGTSTSTVVYTQHSYAQAGDYTIVINCTSGSCRIQGITSRGSTLIDNENISTNSEAYVYQNCIKKIEVGDNILLGSYAFEKCGSLQSITIPKETDVDYMNIFSYCYSLRCIVVPTATTSIGQNSFQYCYAVQKIVLPDSITGTTTYAFYNCASITRLVIRGAYTIESNVFTYCNSLTRIYIPAGTSKVNSYAFRYCRGLKYVAFLNSTKVPTLVNTNALQGISSDCKIIVPDALYEDWIVATNWSTYASKIVKESEA